MLGGTLSQSLKKENELLSAIESIQVWNVLFFNEYVDESLLFQIRKQPNSFYNVIVVGPRPVNAGTV